MPELEGAVSLSSAPNRKGCCAAKPGQLAHNARRAFVADCLQILRLCCKFGQLWQLALNAYEGLSALTCSQPPKVDARPVCAKAQGPRKTIESRRTSPQKLKSKSTVLVFLRPGCYLGGGSCLVILILLRLPLEG